MDPKWNEDQPIYRQLRDRVVAMILEGVLGDGDALPSVRNVAAEYRLNPLTVLKGYQELVDEGSSGLDVAIERQLIEVLLAVEGAVDRPAVDAEVIDEQPVLGCHDYLPLYSDLREHVPELSRTSRVQVDEGIIQQERQPNAEPGQEVGRSQPHGEQRDVELTVAQWGRGERQ